MNTYGNIVTLVLELDGWLYSLAAGSFVAAMSPCGTIFFKGKMSN